LILAADENDLESRGARSRSQSLAAAIGPVLGKWFKSHPHTREEALAWADDVANVEGGSFSRYLKLAPRGGMRVADDGHIEPMDELIQRKATGFVVQAIFEETGMHE
jgi:hypothetical protein